MGKSKADFLELLASGEYYVLQKKHDWNLDDITLKRENGAPADVQNYPYRINQMPTYIFREFRHCFPPGSYKGRAFVTRRVSARNGLIVAPSAPPQAGSKKSFPPAENANPSA